MSTGKCIYQPWQISFSLQQREHLRKTQPDPVQRYVDPGELNSNVYIYIIAPACMVQSTKQKRMQNVYKKHNRKKCGVKQSFPDMVE